MALGIHVALGVNALYSHTFFFGGGGGDGEGLRQGFSV